MHTTAMVAACRTLTVTDNGCEQVCSTVLPELVTVSMSGERPAYAVAAGRQPGRELPGSPDPDRDRPVPGRGEGDRAGNGPLARLLPARTIGPPSMSSQAGHIARAEPGYPRRARMRDARPRPRPCTQSAAGPLSGRRKLAAGS